MHIVNISEFRANLLMYLKKVHNGEEITVTSSGHVLATLVAPVTQREMAKNKLDALADHAKIGNLNSRLKIDG